MKTTPPKGGSILDEKRFVYNTDMKRILNGLRSPRPRSDAPLSPLAESSRRLQNDASSSSGRALGGESMDPRILAAKHRVEPEIFWTYSPRLEPGEYQAYCRSAEMYRDGQFKRWVCAVQFDVLDSGLEVIARLTWYLNLGDGDRPHAGRRTNYWQAWVLANGGPPKRKDRLSPRIYQRRYARVVVADTSKDFRQSAISAEQAYSVIREVVRWETGTGER
jgi:hypothetical protein